MTSVPVSTKIGHGLAKGLGINVRYRNDATPNATTAGESIASSTTDNYLEKEPTVGDYFREIAPTGQTVKHYFTELFPFLKWITRYNATWAAGDLIAGLTVGAVVVPQGMAYAILAKLPPEYGLYTSFVGFILYWAFATSKDITIGTVAVMSQLVGNIVIKVQKKHQDIEAPEIARSLALICGVVVLFIGLTRTGWIVEWISLTAICAFMTGSAITIAAGQVPTLLGITGVNTRGSAYRVIIDTLKALPNSKLDAAMGVSALAMLYGIRIIFSYLTKMQPQRKKLWFFLSTLRIAFVLLLYIMISWLCNRHVKGNAKKAIFKILGPVPSGFKHAGAPKMNPRTINAFLPDLPAAIIVLLIEHIAISKSFGRINNYTINPSQELVAIGFTNVFGPFLGGYPATGSFSRTAIKSKAGVRTPLAGIVTAIVVLLALYALTSVFFYIPSASLAAVIIHAVGDLITPPSTVYQFWEVSPIEVLVFFTGVFVSIFSTIENGIYATVAISAAILFFRLSKAKGRFLGTAKIHTAAAPSYAEDSKSPNGLDSIISTSESPSSSGPSRQVFLPLDRHDGSNPDVKIQSPTPGVFIYRFSEGFNYPNSQHYLQFFTDFIFEQTRRTTANSYAKLGDRPWNDPGPPRGQEVVVDYSLPLLKAIILDFSAVNQVDVSSIQNLIDVRNQLDRYAAPATVSWHIANITSPWTRRALAAGGFGYAKYNSAESQWKPIISLAESDDFAAHEKPGDEENPDQISEKEGKVESSPSGSRKSNAPLYGVNRPFFHIDVASALESANAIIDAEAHSTSA